MTIDNRDAFLDIQRRVDRDMTEMFQAMAAQLRGILVSAADADGKVPRTASERVRRQARKAVEQWFVSRVPVDSQEQQAELNRLRGLAQMARVAAASARDGARSRAEARVRLLEKRIALLENGVDLRCISRASEGLTPYARLMLSGIERTVRRVVKDHATQMQAATKGVPDVRDYLERRR